MTRLSNAGQIRAEPGNACWVRNRRGNVYQGWDGSGSANRVRAKPGNARPSLGRPR